MLTQQEKAVLDIVDRSIRDYAVQIKVPALLPHAVLQTLLTAGILRNPEWFYVKGFRTLYSSASYILFPDYLYSADEARRLQSQCESTAYRLIERIPDGPVYDRVLRAHDFLSRNIQYENTGERENHSVVGPFVQKKAVCEGYAKALKYLLNRMKIPSRVVIGTAQNRKDSSEETHAWNLVRLDGKWTHIDVTFDAGFCSGDVMRYDYFGLCAEEIRRDHAYNEKEYPDACSRELSYYRRSGLLMHQREQLRQYILNGLYSGQSDFVFQLPDTAAAEGLDQKVVSEMQALLNRNNIYRAFTLNCNPPQRVFHIHMN